MEGTGDDAGESQELAILPPTAVERVELVAEKADERYHQASEVARMLGATMPPDYVRIREEFENVEQSVLRVTVDKLRIVLRPQLVRARARRAWVAPTTVFLTILLTHVTTDFQRQFGFAAETWEALYLGAGGVAGVLALVQLVNAVRAPSLDRIASDIEKELKGPRYITTLRDSERPR